MGSRFGLVLSVTLLACGGKQTAPPPATRPAHPEEPAEPTAKVYGPAELAEQPAEAAPAQAAEPGPDASAAAAEPPTEPARPANPAAARALLEQVAAGTKAWSRSCRRGQAPEPCARARALPATHRCGTGPFNTWVPHGRRAGPTKRAIEHMQRAQALWDELSDSDRTSEVRAAYGAALFVLIETHFDDVLATTPPRGLRFDPEKPAQSKRDQKRFLDWLQSAQSHLTELRGRAGDIVEHVPNSEWAAAASGRTGTALEFFAGQLERMEIPATLRKGPYAAEAQAAFCDTVTEQAQPVREQSKRAFEMCVGIAQRVPSASAWLAQCQP